jgi:hypothetical protein
LVLALRSSGLGVLTPAETGLINGDDLEYLVCAAARGYALYSYNSGDYQRLHKEWLQAGREHSGIIVARQQRYSIGEQLRRLMRIRAELSADTMRNRIEFLSHWD